MKKWYVFLMVAALAAGLVLLAAGVATLAEEHKTFERAGAERWRERRAKLVRLLDAVWEERRARVGHCFKPENVCGDPTCCGTLDLDEYERVERLYTPRLRRLHELVREATVHCVTNQIGTIIRAYEDGAISVREVTDKINELWAPFGYSPLKKRKEEHDD